MWKDLSIQQKSEVMKMAISQGLTDLNEIKKMYDASIPNIEASSVNNTYSSVPYNPSPKDVRYAYGGPLGNIYKGTGNKSQKLSKAERENRAMWAKGQPFYKEMRLWDTGLSDVALAGILGNMGLESGFIPTASNGTHHGYLQNENSIRDYIVKYYGGYGHKQQMQYLQDGLRGKLRGGNTSMGKQLQRRFNNYTSAVKNVTDPIKASQLWEKYYEISGGQAMGARQRYAKHFYDQISASGPGAFRRAKLDGTFSPIKDEKHTAYEPSINVEAPVFHTAANDLQWQPPVVASSRQEDIAPLLVQDNKPLIVEPLEDTNSTPKDFSAIWDQIFPKVENTQEEFNPLLDPSTQFTALQSRPRYQMKPTPIINMPVSNEDNDYMLFKPLAKGGNLFEDGAFMIKELPKAYVEAYPDIKVVTPKGQSVTLQEAYAKWGDTPINRDNVPHLTDFLTRQEQPNIATDREIELAQQHRANEEFNRQVDNFFGANWLRPSQWVGAFNPGGVDDGVSFGERLLLGTNNYGLWSPNSEFLREHPYLAEGVNILFDLAAPQAILNGAPEMYNSARYNPYTLSRAMNSAVKNAPISSESVSPNIRYIEKLPISDTRVYSNSSIDAPYDRAVFWGDLETAQRLRDAHFRDASGIDPIHLYHGSPYKDLTYLDPFAKSGTWEGSGGTSFLSLDRPIAEYYAGDVPVSKKMGPIEMKLRDMMEIGRVYDMYANVHNPKVIDYKGGSFSGLGYKLYWTDPIDRTIVEVPPLTGLEYHPVGYWEGPMEINPITGKKGVPVGEFRQIVPQGDLEQKRVFINKSTSQVAEEAMSEGYDAAILKNVNEGVYKTKDGVFQPTTDYAIRDTRLLKLADPITYDDRGLPIPLSLRDNFNIVDFRYKLGGKLRKKKK